MSAANNHKATAESIEAPQRTDVDYGINPEAAAPLFRFLEGRQLESAVLAGSQFAMYVLKGAERGTDIGRGVEREEFDNKFGNTNELMHKEYEPYEDNSVFLIVVDWANTIPVGTLRMIEGTGFDSFKTLNDLQDPDHVSARALRRRSDVFRYYNMEPQTTLDLATIAIRKSLQGSRRALQVQSALYHAAYQYSIDHQIDHWLSVMDVDVRKVYSKTNVPWRAILDVEPFEYLDSADSVAVIAELSEVAPAMRQRRGETKSRVVKMMIDAMLDGIPAEYFNSGST